MLEWGRRFVADEAGADVAEYGLILGFMSIAAVAAIMLSGGAVNAWWTGLSTCVTPILTFGAPSFSGC